MLLCAEFDRAQAEGAGPGPDGLQTQTAQSFISNMASAHLTAELQERYSFKSLKKLPVRPRWSDSDLANNQTTTMQNTEAINQNEMPEKQDLTPEGQTITSVLRTDHIHYHFCLFNKTENNQTGNYSTRF